MAASKGDVLFHNWEEESRKPTKVMDRKHKVQYGHKPNTFWGNDGHGAWQSHVKTSFA